MVEEKAFFLWSPVSGLAWGTATKSRGPLLYGIPAATECRSELLEGRFARKTVRVPEAVIVFGRPTVWRGLGLATVSI